MKTHHLQWELDPYTSVLHRIEEREKGHYLPTRSEHLLDVRSAQAAERSGGGKQCAFMEGPATTEHRYVTFGMAGKFCGFTLDTLASAGYEWRGNSPPLGRPGSFDQPWVFASACLGITVCKDRDLHGA